MTAEDRGEFATLTQSIMTLFRCFTDGCSAYDGTPLQAAMQEKWGFPFLVGYFLIQLFVTMGLFNLIMAIFLESVLRATGQRKQTELGNHRFQQECLLHKVVTQGLEEVVGPNIE